MVNWGELNGQLKKKANNPSTKIVKNNKIGVLMTYHDYPWSLMTKTAAILFYAYQNEANKPRHYKNSKGS